MTLEASVLQDDAVQAVPGGCAVDVHLPWYRSLPLSCVEDVAVTVNGERAARDDLRVRLGDDEVPLDDLADKTEDWWFVQDPLTLTVPLAADLPSGADADVAVHLAIRIPYIILGPEQALVQHAQVIRKVVVR